MYLIKYLKISPLKQYLPQKLQKKRLNQMCSFIKIYEGFLYVHGR